MPLHPPDMPTNAPPRFDVHGMSSPNVIKVILLLEELGAPYRLVRVDVFAGEQRAPAFTRLNPNGKVPVLVDRDGPDGQPTTIFESGAILVYLAETHRAFLPDSGAPRYAVLQWLMLQMGGLGPTAGQAIHFTALNETDLYARRRFTIEIERQLEVLDRRLAACAYVAGPDYSIADIAIHPWIGTLARFFPAVMERAHLARWHASIAERPAALRTAGITAELVAESRRRMKAAEPGMLDRYFGRVPWD